MSDNKCYYDVINVMSTYLESFDGFLSKWT